jgi:hypothetical protein
LTEYPSGIAEAVEFRFRHQRLSGGRRRWLCRAHRGKILSDTRFAQLLATAVGDYIERQGTVSPQLEGRITAQD